MTEGLMELSARNQLKATVKSVRSEGVMTEVIMDLGGQEMVATITKGSAQRLRLKTGDAVLAIVKASEVIVGK